VNFQNNTGVGSGALGTNTSGSNNTANGWEALYENTSGSYNTADGFLALEDNTNGFQNTADGAYALHANTSGSFNTASGWVALFDNTSGSNNMASGAYALFDNLTGGYNTASGFSALYYNNAGYSNTAAGAYALYANMGGGNNTANGVYALSANNAGNNNTAVGYSALLNSTSGNNNIALGFLAGMNLYTSDNNNIDIGNQGVEGDNNYIRIGTPGTQSSTFIAGITGITVSGGAPVYVTPSGQLGVSTSSKRFKQDIQSMGEASDLILSLRPVTFHYKPELDPKGISQFGLVAEEVDKVDPELVVRDDQNQIYTVRYDAINAMLLNEFLKQHRKVEQQAAEIQELKEKTARMDSLEKRLNTLEQLLRPVANGDSGRLQMSAR
jgi:hypothetical protein